MDKEYDQELKKYYVEMRDKIKEEHQQYLNKHPEIQDLLNDFVSNCLLEKPKDIYEHAQKYFQYFNLKREIEKQFPLVIAGCSGAGKGTMIKKLMGDYKDLFQFSVSYTTRQPRHNEVDRQDYFFVSKEQFEKEMQEGNFIESCYVHGNYYGTHKSQISQIMNKGNIPLLDVDIQGAIKVKAIYDQAVFIWIDLPDLNVQKQRLIQRATDSQEVIEKRISQSQKELDLISTLPYFQRVLNQDIEECYKSILTILKHSYKDFS